MPATSRGATLLGPDKLEIREYPIPDIPADGGLVKIELGGVCGSDVKYLHGGKAQLPYALILGHEILGRVEKTRDPSRSDPRRPMKALIRP